MFKNLRSMTRYIERSLVSGLCLCLVTHLCLTLWDPLDWSLLGSCVRGDSAGKNTGVGSHALLQGIFPTQGLNSGLPNFRQIIYHLSHQGRPWILEWIAYPFSKGSSRPRDQTCSLLLCRQILYHLSHQGHPKAQGIISPRWPLRVRCGHVTHFGWWDVSGLDT